MDRTLRISIVTPCYNAARFIGDAIESVAGQKSEIGWVEHIIADAESTDGTGDVLSKFPHLHIDRRKDRGIYDGMNRAIAMAQGDIIGIVNADDVLAPHALSHAVEIFAATDADIVTGAFDVIDSVGERCAGPFKPTCPPSFEGLLFGIPAINARFFRRSLFSDHGPFELELGLAADRAWLLMVQRKGVRFAYTPQLLYRYRQHEESHTLAGDGGARDRVWSGNVIMAEKLLQKISPVESDSKALKALRAVEAAKLAVTELVGGAKVGKFTGRLMAAGQLSSIVLGSPHHLLHGLSSWQRFRDQHSDTSP